MSDFLNQVFETARQTATNLLDKVEQIVTDEPKTDTDWKSKYDRLVKEFPELQDEVEFLNEALVEARTALKLFLDGETRVSFVVPRERAESLNNYSVETYWESDGHTDNVVVRQWRI